MRRVTVNMIDLKQQLELVDIASDYAQEDDAKLLHDLGTLLDKIIGGEIVLFYKDTNGTTE
jgi:hypothetical protein